MLYIYAIYLYYMWIDTLWIYSMSTLENTDENRTFLFVQHTTSILAKYNTWYFERSGDISCSVLVNQSHTDESWEVRNTCLWIDTLWTYSLSTQENTDENRMFLFVHHTTSILAKLSTWCFEHSGDISCSLLVNPSQTYDSWDEQYMDINNIYIYMYIYIYIYMYIYISTFNVFTIKCHTIILSKRFLKKIRLMKSLLKTVH